MEESIPAAKYLAKNVNILWVIIASALVFFMQAGFLLLETGLVRSKNSINVAIKNLIDYVVGSFCFFVIGYGLMYGTSYKGFFGKNVFLLHGIETGQEFAFFLFQVTFMGTAATIVSGAVAERIKFNAYIICSAFVSLLIYPIFGHWTWGGGWLSQMGFIDFAGSTVVHSIGGWVSLAGVIVLGPRADRFDINGRPMNLYGHNLPLAVLGAFILWFGWFGFNGGSTLSLSDSIPKIIVNTCLAACGGGVTAIIFSYVLKGIPHVEGTINGVLGGLVAITASCDAVSPEMALVIGGIAGVLVEIFTYLMHYVFRLDDVVGAFPVHGICGIWGTVSVGIFNQDPGLRSWHQILIQLTGIGVACLWAFSLGLILFIILKMTIQIRVSAEDEERGLNESEHGSKTVWIDLMAKMSYIEKSKDLRGRIDIDRGTESGVVADLFNKLITSLSQIIGIVQDNSNRIQEESDQLDKSSHSINSKVTDQMDHYRIILERIHRTEESLKSVIDLVHKQEKSHGSTLALTEDMNSGIVEVIQNVSSSNSVTNEIKFLAIEGEKTLKKTSLSMQEMNSSAKKVEEIVNVLQKISEQLSMLSINAAIESGRERETSSGFAVVAESIAKLSAKTGSNSKQAGIYLKEIWNTIHDSIHSIQETTISFQNIIEKIPHLTMYMKHVVESTNAYSIKTNIVHDTMKENSQTSSMITKEIVARFDEISEIHTLFERINQTSQEIKKELEELENMSLMLNGQTVKMHRAVDVFQIETNPT
jgi:Amt family ammonium transporter